jgi:hypothetical protein
MEVSNIIYKARKFSKKSYDENDNYAKIKITKFLINRGHEVIQDKENYNHDLITKKNNLMFYFEFEVKRNYPFTSKKDYKFKSVSFLGRKIRLHEIYPFYYMILCYETNCVVFCHSSKIFKIEYKEKLILKKYDRNGNDEMYRVPINECNFFNVI